MDKFAQGLAEAFHAQLQDSFVPCALYFDCMDYVEYIANDSTYIADRIDKHLTVLLDSTQNDVVGFRIKGFKALFNKHLKPLYDLTDKDFLPIIAVVTALIEELGDELLHGDAKRHRAYKKVLRLANDSKAALSDVPFCEVA